MTEQRIMKSKYWNVAMNRNSICCSFVFVKFGLRISAKMIVLKYKRLAVKNRKSKIIIYSFCQREMDPDTERGATESHSEPE